jgi:hypothetical protein
MQERGKQRACVFCSLLGAKMFFEEPAMGISWEFLGHLFP